MDWDPEKRLKNLAKHGVDFGSAELFEWPSARILASLGKFEPWLSAYGLITGRLHVLVYSIETRTVRIISLRKANRRELRGWLGRQ